MRLSLRMIVFALGVVTTTWCQVPRTFFGMTINHAPVQKNTWPDVPIGAIRLWDTGTSWRAMNPAPGVYDWSKLDGWIRIAQEHKVDILYTFGRTPDWVSADPRVNCSYGPGQCAPPKDLQAWDDFVRALANHAAGRIKYWEVWNEANRPESWTGSIPQLVEMAKRARVIILGVDPQAVLLTPSATGKKGPEWMAQYLEARGGDYSDVIALHGYSGTDPEDVAVLLKRYKQVVAGHKVDKKPLWDTEASWGKSEKLPDLGDRAAYLTVTYLLHLSNGIERFYWYAWDNNEWGTLARGLNVEPAGNALRQLAGLMQGATLDKPCTKSADGVWSCSFVSNKGDKILATWSPHARTISVPARFGLASGILGNKSPVSGTLLLSSSPIFLFQKETGPLASSNR